MFCLSNVRARGGASLHYKCLLLVLIWMQIGFGFADDDILTLTAHSDEQVVYVLPLIGHTVVTRGGDVWVTSTNMDYIGNIEVRDGTFMGANATAFGGIGDLVVSNNAALRLCGDAKTSTLNTRHVYVAGDGPLGGGAIMRESLDSSDNGDAIFKDITLTGA